MLGNRNGNLSILRVTSNSCKIFSQLQKKITREIRDEGVITQVQNNNNKKPVTAMKAKKLSPRKHFIANFLACKYASKYKDQKLG